MELIYTNIERLNLQTSYNETWAKAVNGAIEALKNLCGELTDAQLTTFLLSPSSLANELVATARKEFEAYVANVPESVRLSMSFSDGGKADAIKKLHKSLMAEKPFNMIDKTSIVKGVCVLDEEALKNECSVFGGAESKKIYDKAVECAKLLNELDALIHLNPVGAECIENFGRWNGVINFQYDKKASKYSVNAELLPLLDKDKE